MTLPVALMTPEELEQLADLVAERLSRPSGDSVDWGQIPIPRAANHRPQCGDLSDGAVFRLKAIAEKDYNGSVSGVVKTAVMKYLREKWPCHCEDFRGIAAREGLTLEECLNRIASGDLKL